jgi:Asp-tRNA(Asn)/Glu-tRNA(Gln) amidotransferase A subunit family amidase
VHADARVMADETRASAEQLDREVAAGSIRGPLHGLPVAVKTSVYGVNTPPTRSVWGMPVGFQLLGLPFDERALFRIARAYERNREWSRLSPPIAQLDKA